MKSKKMIATMFATLLCVANLTGCGTSYNDVNVSTFWDGLEEKGFSQTYDLTEAYLASQEDQDLSYMDEMAYYYDGEKEFILIDTKSASQADKLFESLTEQYDELVNTKATTTVGGTSKWTGKNSDNDLCLVVYKTNDDVIVGSGKASDTDLLKGTIEFVLTKEQNE